MKNQAVQSLVPYSAVLLITASLMAATKVLHFPPDQYVGSLSIEDPCLGTEYLETGRDLSFPFGFDPQRVCLAGDWDFVGPAQGDVTVTADRNVQLTVVLRPAPADMSRLSALSQHYLSDRVAVDPYDLWGLAQLEPDALYGLQVSCLIPRRNADTSILKPISRLTGLQILSLCETGVNDSQIAQLRSLRSLRALELGREFSLSNAGLAALRELPDLEYLDLDTGATDVGFEHLGQLQSLRWLRLRAGRTWGPGLAELAKLPRLERLCLWGTTGISDRQVRYLEGLTRLKSLTLWGTDYPLTDASLASIGKMTNLEELYFIRINTRFTEAGFAQLRNLEHLRVFRLGFERISDAKVVAALPQLERVSPIDFTGENMKALGALPHLKSVGLHLVPLSREAMGEAASHLGVLKDLEEVEFSGAYRDGHLIDQQVACLESLENLRKLRVDGRHLTDRSVTSLSRLRQLESLSFSGVVSKGVLSQLNGLTNLRSLNVRIYSDNAGGIDETPLDLSALTNLKGLKVWGCDLKDSDLAFLANLPDLEWLSLQSGPPSEAALVYLKDLRRLKYLEISDLTCTTGNGLAWLAGLKALDSMRLRGRITDTALHQLPALPSLRGISIETDAPIRPETVALLRQRLPAIQDIEIREPRHLGRESMEFRGTPRRPATRSSPGRQQRIPRGRRRR